MFCGKCGYKMDGGEMFCPMCGNKVETIQRVKTEVTTTVVEDKKEPAKLSWGLATLFSVVVLINVFLIMWNKYEDFMDIASMYPQTGGKYKLVLWAICFFIVIVMLAVMQVSKKPTASMIGFVFCGAIGILVMLVFMKYYVVRYENSFMDTISRLLMYYISGMFSSNMWLGSYIGLVFITVVAGKKKKETN